MVLSRDPGTVLSGPEVLKFPLISPVSLNKFKK
jgi:hypothetical protein